MTERGPDNSDRSEAPAAELRRRYIRGGAATLLAQGGRFVLTLGSGAVLARMLTPADFGLMAMAFTVISFGEMLSQLGLSTATIQRPSISHAQISALFWVNVTLGAVAWLGLALLAPLVGRFYANEQVVPICRALGLIFVLGTLSAQHRALLSREMRFVALALNDTLALALSVVVGVVAAWMKMGCWSLVLMYLAREASSTIGLWRSSKWRPSRPAFCPELRALLRFGAHYTASLLVDNLARQCDSLLLGLWSGAYTLGLYNKAYQFATLPNQLLDIPMTRVLVPTLSRLQGEPERYRRYFVTAVMLLAALELPIITFILVDAELVIRVLLGPQWVSAAMVLRILCVAGFYWPLSAAMNWAFISLGRVREKFRWEALSSALMLGGFVVGLRWGAVGMATAFAASWIGWRLSFIGFGYCLRGSALRPRDVFLATAQPAVACFAAGVLWYALNPHLPAFGNAFLRLPLDGVLYLMLYAAAGLALPAGRAGAVMAVGEARRRLSALRRGRGAAEREHEPASSSAVL